jgi:hypothetical protein
MVDPPPPDGFVVPPASTNGQSTNGQNGSSLGLAAAGPPHGVSLIDHALISAEIAEAQQPTAKILEQHRLTESAWTESTMYWMKRIGDDAVAAGAEARLAIVYSDAFGRAQDGLRPVPVLTPEEWAALTVEIQQRGNPAAALAARNLSHADYLRLARHWAKALSSDPGLNNRFVAAYDSLQRTGG